MTARVGPGQPTATLDWIDVLWEGGGGGVIGEISHAENMEQSIDAHGQCLATAALIDYSGLGAILGTCGH